MQARVRFDIYLNTPVTGLVHAADCVLAEDNGVLTRVDFRYRDDYLNGFHPIAIDPVQLPLTAGEVVLSCQGGTPAFVDDYLPDAWGRRVLAQLAFYRDQKHFNANSVIDTLALLSHSRIGALSIVPLGDTPQFEIGHPITALARAERTAQLIDEGDYSHVDLNEMNLIYLANAGTGIGGARPKALLHDEQYGYIAKFNRHTQDAYNNARVELACLLMARAAGLDMGDGKIVAGINGREVLLLERFDIASEGRRYHLMTVNGLLKEPHSQRDLGSTFRYDDICQLLRQHSQHIEADLTQLLRLMLFNRAINNTDDHERNFSLINRGDGFQLAPAYDLVPSVAAGEYHAAGFRFHPNPPRPSEAAKLGKIFGLPKTVVTEIAEHVAAAVEDWLVYAGQADVSDNDSFRISRCIHL